MANIFLYANNATSSLLGNVAPTDTVIALANGQGARFPNPIAGQSFLLTIEDTNGNIEIVEVTGRTVDTLTVVRGREGTTARAFSASTVVEARVTAGMLGYLDWKAVAGVPGGAVVLDVDAMVPASVLSKGVKAVGDPLYNPLLGWTPIQQGGGTGMNTDKVYLGYRAGTTDFALQHGTDTPQRVVTVNGVTTKLGGAQAKLAANGVEDDLYLGSYGGYVYGNATSMGFWGPAGGMFSVNMTTGAASFPGPLSSQGQAVSLANHTQTIASVTGLQGELNVRLRTDIGGTQALSSNVEVAGYVRAAGGIYDSSDERLKTDIQPMSLADSEAIVRGAVPVRYHDVRMNIDSIGFGAGQLETVAPELVPTDSSGMKGVMYQRLTAPLIGVVQALLSERDMVRARLNALEAR